MIYTITIFVILLYVVYKWHKTKHEYWKRRGIYYVKPLPVFGNYKSVVLMKQRMDSLWRDVYEQHKDEKVVGLYQGLQPVLLIRDPELLKYVFIKDFSNFANRTYKHKQSLFDDNLFFIDETRWKILRQKLTPLFTSGKLKQMVPLIEKCIGRFISYTDRLVENDRKHELRSLIAKYTLEVIGSCAFGVEIDALNDNAQLFEEIGNLIFNPPATIKTWMSIELLMPQLVKTLNQLHYRTLVDEKVLNFFINLTDKLLKEREGKPKTRHDFMDLMIELKEQGKMGRRDDDRNLDLEMDQELIAAQTQIFYAAGFETSSSTMSFMLHELSNNEQIQDRVYEEIVNVSERHGGKINYEAVSDLQYLGMCFDETLRKYPIVSTLDRVSSKDYTFPGTKITIEKGTKIAISPTGIQNDPKYYPHPSKFDPERFSPENKNKIPTCAYLPFGEGPRNCIGMRFAKVSSMLMMGNFIKKFKVTPLEGASKDIKFSKRALTLAPEAGLWVKFSKR